MPSPTRTIVAGSSFLSEAGLMVCAGALLANALLTEPKVWVLFVVSAAMAGLDSIHRPALEAMAPRLVDRDELTAEAALSSLRMNVGMVVGPAFAGLLIAGVGLPVHLPSRRRDVRGLARPPRLHARDAAARAGGAAEPRRHRRGVRYAAGRPVLIGTYVVDIVAMVFGMSEALFPRSPTSSEGPALLGLLYTAPAVGAILATLTSGWTSRIHRHGLAVILAAAGWGVAVIGFGLAPGVVVALVCLALAGASDMISGIFRSTIWNQTIPDHLRGRLAGIELISYSSGPLLGNIESGAVAAGFGVRASAVSGGILCVLGVGGVAAALPRFRRYDSRVDE